MFRIILLILTLLSSITLIGQELGKRMIISCPDMEDINSINIVNKLIEDSLINNTELETILLFDNYGLFSIKGFEREVSFDSTDFYCAIDYKRINNLLAKEKTTIYGATVSSDIITYLHNRNKDHYKELDSLSIVKGNKSFGGLLLYKELKNHPELIDFIIEKYNLDCVEEFILKTVTFRETKIEDIFSNSEICNSEFSNKNIVWIRDWTDKNPKIDGVIQVNIIPSKLNLSTINNKIRKNKITYKTNLTDIQFIEYEKLPNRIKLNDFLKKVDKLEIKNDINIYVPFTTNCRNH